MFKEIKARTEINAGSNTQHQEEIPAVTYHRMDSILEPIDDHLDNASGCQYKSGKPDCQQVDADEQIPVLVGHIPQRDINQEIHAEHQEENPTSKWHKRCDGVVDEHVDDPGQHDADENTENSLCHIMPPSLKNDRSWDHGPAYQDSHQRPVYALWVQVWVLQSTAGLRISESSLGFQETAEPRSRISRMP